MTKSKCWNAVLYFIIVVKNRPILSLQHFYDLSDEQISWWIKPKCIKYYNIITICYYVMKDGTDIEKKKPMCSTLKSRKYKMKLPFFGLLWDAFGGFTLFLNLSISNNSGPPTWIYCVDPHKIPCEYTSSLKAFCCQH